MMLKQTIEVRDDLMSDWMLKLIKCRVGRKRIPDEFARSLVHKAERLFLYEENNRRELLFTACAVLRKYYFDKYGKEFDLALDEKCADRSYQFGRFLAIAEKIEKDALSARCQDTKRESTAIRLQPMFVQRPGTTAGRLMTRLKAAYYPRLPEGLKISYEKMIGQIMEEISKNPICDFDKKLEGTYLLGYEQQRNFLYTRKNEEEKN